MVNAVIFVSVMAAFVAITIFLGWKGYKHTKTQDSFLIGRNKSNSILIGLAYGATFLSASAIVGFGGMASRYGMGMMWLVFLNLFVGLIIAFILFGKRMWRLNRKLGALTFADFLGKRFKSPFIRSFTAIVVLVGMPIYCAAVLLGGANFLVATDIGISKDVAIFLLSLVVIAYVAYGGIIAVMYNDALQAAIMFIGMAMILIVTYVVLSGHFDGGISGIHAALDGLWDKPGMAYDPLKTPGNMQGITGWASFPEFGSNAWWFLVSTILLGVGIGALAQPQLAARFMTAKDTKTLNKSLWIGAIFMIVIVGTAYTVGALTNLYFAETYGLNAMDHITKINGKFNLDLVIPTFVNDIFGSMGTTGELFIVIFVFALICAATSTMCALLHTMGAAAGYDLWSETEKKFKNKQITKPSIKVTRIATVAMMVVVIILAYLMPPSIIAKATSMFMGLTAAAILPAYGHAVFAKKPNMLAAKLSIIVGSMIWFVWALFVCEGIGGILAPGVLPLVSGQIIYVDPLILALPISIVVLVLTCYLKPAKGEGEDGNEDKERPKEKDLALDG